MKREMMDVFSFSQVQVLLRYQVILVRGDPWRNFHEMECSTVSKSELSILPMLTILVAVDGQRVLLLLFPLET